MVKAGKPWIEVLGDQVQAVAEAAPHPVAGFVILGEDGSVEYRSPWAREILRDRLMQAARAL